jgi:hypothetical protein
MNDEFMWVMARCPTIFWIFVMMVVILLLGWLDKYV